MKMHKYLKLTTLLLVAVLVLGMLPTVALAADVGLGIQEMVTTQIANPGAVVADANRKVDYQFLFGNFDGKALSPFTTNSGDYLFEGSGDPTNAIWMWQWRCNAGSDTVLKITAKENMFFKSEIQEGGSFHAGWAVGTTFRFVQENAAGERKEVKQLVVKDVAQSVEDSTVITHLAAGESLYIVYSGNGLMTADFCPWFTINTETYDAAQNPFYVAPAPDPKPEPEPDPNVDIGLGLQGMVDTQIANLGKPVVDAGAKVDYQFLYGSFANKSLNPMPKNEGDVLYAGNDFGSATNFVRKWDWHCDAGTDTVLKITAKENMYFKSEIQEDGKFNAGWALGSSYRFIQESVSGEQKLLKTLEVKDVELSVEDSTVITHLAAGESLYIVYSAEGYAVADFCPWFTINRGSYDATLNPFYVAPAPDDGGDTEPDDTGDSILLASAFAMTAAACALAVLLNKKRLTR